MPQLTSAFTPSHTTILYFKVPRCRKLAEVTSEIPLVTMPKMGVSHLLNIRQEDVGDIDELSIYKVVKEVLISLPPWSNLVC